MSRPLGVTDVKRVLSLIYCVYWSTHTMGDIKMNGVKSHSQFYFLPIPLGRSVNHLVSSCYCNYFYLGAFRMTLWYMAVCVWEYLYDVTVSKTSQNTPKRLCMTQPCSQLGVQGVKMLTEDWWWLTCVSLLFLKIDTFNLQRPEIASWTTASARSLQSIIVLWPAAGLMLPSRSMRMRGAQSAAMD